MSAEVDNIIIVAQKPPLQDGAVHVCRIVSTILPHTTHAVANRGEHQQWGSRSCFWTEMVFQLLFLHDWSVATGYAVCCISLMLTELPDWLTGEAYRFHLPNSSSQYQSHSVARLKSGSSSELQVEILRASWNPQVIVLNLTRGLLELHEGETDWVCSNRPFTFIFDHPGLYIHNWCIENTALKAIPRFNYSPGGNIWLPLL